MVCDYLLLASPQFSPRDCPGKSVAYPLLSERDFAVSAAACRNDCACYFILAMTREKPKVLVAEDNRVLADLLRFNLERAGFSVQVAKNGRCAIEQIQQEQFDLIIADHCMPHANGLDVCRYAREDERHKAVAFFYCTGSVFDEDLDRTCEELQITKVFIKPFSPQEVIQSAKDAIGAAAVSS